MAREVLGASPLVLVALLSPLAAGLLDAASAQRVDCRKFVFAPSCRGVAAKRSDAAAAGARGVADDDVGLDADDAEMPTKLSGDVDRPLLRLSGDRVGASRIAWAGGRRPPSSEGSRYHQGRRRRAGGEEEDEEEEEAWRLGTSPWGAEDEWDDAWTTEDDVGRASEIGGHSSRERKTTTTARGASPEGHRKMAKTPATYDWFPSDSGRHRRRRGGDRLSLESVNYDY